MSAFQIEGPTGATGETEVAYAEFTSDVQTSGDSAVTVVTAPSFTADGTSTYRVEFFTSLVANFNAGVAALIDLRLDPAGANTHLGQMGAIASSNMQVPMMLATHLVPSAGATVYSITLRRSGSASNPLVAAGPGGSGQTVPGYIRVTKVA